MHVPNPHTRLSFKRSQEDGFISVIVPVYRDASGLADTLASLARQTFDASRFEVIVGNDGTDEAVARIADSFGAKTIPVAPRQGSYAARNRALEESRGEFLAFVDADISVPPEWLATGLAALRSHRYVGGRVLFPAHQLTRLSHHYEAAVAFNNSSRFRRHHYSPTANLFAARSLFETLGGFDTRFRSGGDAEFGDRAFRALPADLAFCEALVVFHPPRGYAALVRKVERTTLGLRDKARHYPERFGALVPGPGRVLLIPFMPYAKVLLEGSASPWRKASLAPIALWFGLVEAGYFIAIFWFGLNRPDRG